MERRMYSEYNSLALLKEYSTMMRKLDGFRFQSVKELSSYHTVAWLVHPSFATSVHTNFFKTMPPSLGYAYIMWVIDVLVKKQEHYWVHSPNQLLGQHALLSLFLQRDAPGNIVLWLPLSSKGCKLTPYSAEVIAQLRHKVWKIGCEAPHHQLEEIFKRSPYIFDYMMFEYPKCISISDFFDQLPAAKNHDAGMVVTQVDNAFKLKHSQEEKIKYGV